MKKIAVLSAIIFSPSLLASPVYSISQNMDEGEADHDVPGGLMPDDDATGPVGVVDELRQEHSTITNIMIDHAAGDFSVADDLVFSMTVVDEENRQLIVILDPILLEMDLVPDVGDIEDLVGEDVPIKLQFGTVTPEHHVNSPQSEIDRWISLYNDRCDSPTHNSLCEALVFNLGTANHYTLDSNNRWQPQGSGSNSDSTSGAAYQTSTVTFFFDDFESGNLDKWTESGESDWQADTFDERRNPPNHPSSNKVAEADNCDTSCTITVTNAIDISGATSPTLTFWRYVDTSLDDYDDGDGEYLKLEVTKDGRVWTQLDIWTEENRDDDDMWHSESYDLSSYKSDDFKLRFVASMSSPGEDVGIDDVAVKGTGSSAASDSDNDGTPDATDECPQKYGIPKLDGCPDTKSPVITVPDDITAEQKSSRGVYVSVSATAVDDVDGNVPVSCDHRSGWFTLGKTSIVCRAVDNAGNRGYALFTVTITSTTPTTNTASSDQCDANNTPEENLSCLAELGSHLGLVDRRQLNGGERLEYAYTFINRTHFIDEIIHTSTTTLATELEDGTDVLVVSGHSVIGIDKGEGDQPDLYVTPISAELAVNNTGNRLLSDHIAVVAPRPAGATLTHDAGLIELDVIVPVKNRITGYDDAHMIVGNGRLSDLDRLDSVTIHGQFNDDTGYLLFKNATVFTSNTINNFVLIEQGIAAYDSRAGDSGAPIIAMSDGVRIVGAHYGVACTFEAPSEGQGRLDLSGPTCPGSANYYKVFSPWETIREDLGLK